MTEGATVNKEYVLRAMTIFCYVFQ